MNKKPYLSVILFFVTIFISVFSAKSQSRSDTIRMEKMAGIYFYYMDNVRLSKWELNQLLSQNHEADKLMIKSNNLRTATYFLSFTGGACVGVSLGLLLGSAIFQVPLNTKVFIPCLIAGTAAIGFSIAFEMSANRNAKEAIAVFNNSIKNKNNTTFNLGISPNGLMVNLNF